jgi:hypothetical protein
MVAERPNAGAVGHQDRCRVIRRRRGGGFVPIVAHSITPTDVAAESLGISARSSPTATTLPSVIRALSSWRRFSHEGARRSRVAVQVWPRFETLRQNPQHPGQPGPELRLGVSLHVARTSERSQDRHRVCRDEFLCSQSWHAWRHPRRKLDFGSFEPAPGFSSCDRNNGRIRGQPTFFCRMLGRSGGFAVATFLALPAIGSSISPCPWMRLGDFFGGGGAAFS